MGPLALIPNPFDPTQWVDSVVRGFFSLLVRGITVMLGSILGWMSGPVTEADLTGPWQRSAAGRVLAVAVALGVGWLICTAVAGAVRRGPAGAAEPLGRLLVVGAMMGFLRLWADLGQRFSDALTVWLAPNFEADIEKIMAAIVTWPSAVPAAALALWFFFAVLAFVAVFIISIQLLLRKWAILLLWVTIPFAAVFSIGQQGFTLLKRHALLLTGVLLAKPAVAFVISLLAAPLDNQGEATWDEAGLAVAGLGIASIAPWVIVGLLARSLPTLVRASRAGDPVEAAKKAANTGTGPADVVKTARHRYDSLTGSQATHKAAFGKAATTGSRAVPALAAATTAAGAARTAGGAAGQVVAGPVKAVAPVALNVGGNGNAAPALLVADKGGRVTDNLGTPAPGEPAGLSQAERHAWRSEHVAGADRPAVADGPPLFAPDGLTKPQRRAWEAEHVYGNVETPSQGAPLMIRAGDELSFESSLMNGAVESHPLTGEVVRMQPSPVTGDPTPIVDVNGREHVVGTDTTIFGHWRGGEPVSPGEDDQ